MWLWLWPRLQPKLQFNPPDWELSFAVGTALKRLKKKKKVKRTGSFSDSGEEQEHTYRWCRFQVDMRGWDQLDVILLRDGLTSEDGDKQD